MTKRQFYFLFLSTICIFQNAKAQNNSDYTYYDNSSYLDIVLDGKFKSDEPGFSYKVLKNGEVIKGASFGVIDLDTQGQITSETQFYIASLGKTFTSAAILILFQNSELELSDKLEKYFNNFPEFAHKITIEQLLNHTSGLPDHFDEMEEEVSYLDNKVVLNFLADQQLLFQPGTDYSYSNSAYVLLAEIIEIVSGDSFSKFLNDKIFFPLGMEKTIIIENSNQIPTRRAKGYSLVDDKFVLNDYENIYTLGAGGIYSTVDDIVKWDQALYGNEILTASSKKLMFTKAEVPNVPTYLAMGWMDESFGPKTKEFTGLSYVMSFGSLKGFRARLMRFPDYELSIIALSNSGTAHLWGTDFAKAFFRRVDE